jgi:hypothetical protein
LLWHPWHPFWRQTHPSENHKWNKSSCIYLWLVKISITSWICHDIPIYPHLSIYCWLKYIKIHIAATKPRLFCLGFVKVTGHTSWDTIHGSIAPRQGFSKMDKWDVNFAKIWRSLNFWVIDVAAVPHLAACVLAHPRNVERNWKMWGSYPVLLEVGSPRCRCGWRGRHSRTRPGGGLMIWTW